MKKLTSVDWVSFILVIIGGINWGLIGFFNFNLVEVIFGEGMVTKVIYALVGLAALYMIYYLFAKSFEKETTESPAPEAAEPKSEFDVE